VLLKASGMAKSTFHYYSQRYKLPEKYMKEKELIYQLFHKNKGIVDSSIKCNFIINHFVEHTKRFLKVKQFSRSSIEFMLNR
ncbi:hypothetical protein EZS27_030129, partial [termite gut metagenome]